MAILFNTIWFRNTHQIFYMMETGYIHLYVPILLHVIQIVINRTVWRSSNTVDLNSIGKKVKLSLLTGREGPLGCETSRFPHFLDNRLINGGEVVSLTRRPPFTPRKIPGTHFCYRRRDSAIRTEVFSDSTARQISREYAACRQTMKTRMLGWWRNDGLEKKRS
jgi:hypothetical protein